MQQSSATAASPSLPPGGVIADRLRNAKKAAVADQLGKSDSWAAKVCDGECGVLLQDIDALLRALNLKAVDAGKVCVDRDIYVALKAIAGAALEAPRKLEWE